MSIDDERCARLEQIARLEQKMAGFLVRTPYVVLLSIPGINIVTAAEFAGEMGPIANYASDQAITGRAGIYPSRYQSDKVDRCDGPLVRRANRKLRGVIMMIADNLLARNRFFQTLKERWVAAGMDERAMCVRAAKRFCRIAYQMVAGGQVFRHPSCQKHDAILRKLSLLPRRSRDLDGSGHGRSPSSHRQHPQERARARGEKPLRGDATRFQPAPIRAAPAGRDSARSLGQAGGDCCRIELEGGDRPHVTARAEEPNNALWPRGC